MHIHCPHCCSPIEVVAEFGKEYQLILPDLRGHGRSNNPSGKFTHRQAALDVLALLDAMNIKKCRGMGVSSGSHVLLHMATQQPDRVEAAVFAGGASYLPAEARAVYSAITYDGLPGIDKESRCIAVFPTHTSGSCPMVGTFRALA